MLDIELTGPSGEPVPVASLVDSGADICIFDLGYAGALGIDLQECEHAAGVGVGGVPYDFWKAEVTLEPEGLPAIAATVMFMDSPRVDGLLGQEGFFEAHPITLRRDRNEYVCFVRSGGHFTNSSRRAPNYRNGGWSRSNRLRIPKIDRGA